MAARVADTTHHKVRARCLDLVGERHPAGAATAVMAALGADQKGWRHRGARDLCQRKSSERPDWTAGNRGYRARKVVGLGELPPMHFGRGARTFVDLDITTCTVRFHSEESADHR